jgi:NTE family protein
MDLSLGSGLIKGERLMEFLRENFADRAIEQLPLPFGAVATSLRTGPEVWLREGSTLNAVRASIALPALFAPVWRDGAVLVDGGLVNAVPVSLARAMGADVVIAVDLGTRHEHQHHASAIDTQPHGGRAAGSRHCAAARAPRIARLPPGE